mgnify:CR=1 FL=1
MTVEIDGAMIAKRYILIEVACYKSSFPDVAEAEDGG